MLVVRQLVHQLVDLGSSPLFKGGEARIFVFPNDLNTLAKIYDEPGNGDRLKKVTTLIAQPFPAAVRGIGGVVAPIDWITDPKSGEFQGYAMNRVWNAKPILGTWSPLLSDYRPFDSRYRIARKVAELFVQIENHPNNSLIFADVNPQNVLVDDNDDAWLIDLDSCQMTGHDGQFLNSPMYTLEFLSPRLQNKNLEHVARTRPDERYAIGVLLFKLMMNGFHPNDARAIDTSRDVPELRDRILRGVWAFGDKPTDNFLPPTKAPDFGFLPDQIRDLFSRCFVEGFNDPFMRPTAQEWRDAFSQNLIVIPPAPNPLPPPHIYNPNVPPPVVPPVAPPIAPVVPQPVVPPVVPQPVPPTAPVQPAYVRPRRNRLHIALSAVTIGFMFVVLFGLARSAGRARRDELTENRGEPAPGLIRALQSDSSTVVGNRPSWKMGTPAPPLIREFSDSVNAEAMAMFRKNERPDAAPPLIRRHSQANVDTKTNPIRNRPNDLNQPPVQNGPMRIVDGMENKEPVPVWEHLRRAFVQMADDLDKAYKEFMK